MTAYRLRFDIDEKRKKASRTVLVPAQASFMDLDTAIQAVMEWSVYHPHRFIVDGAEIGSPFDGCGIDERTAALADRLGSEISYVFGMDPECRVDVSFLGEVDDDIGYAPVLEEWSGKARSDAGGRKAVDVDLIESTLLFGVSGVRSDDAKDIDPMIIVVAMLMMAPMSEYPLVFDARKFDVRIAVDEPVPELPPQMKVKPSKIAKFPQRFSYILEDPVPCFEDMIEHFLVKDRGHGTPDGADPWEELDAYTEPDEVYKRWWNFRNRRFTDIIHRWAADNGYFLSMYEICQGKTGKR